MDRRDALKFLGGFFALIIGRPVLADDDFYIGHIQDGVVSIGETFTISFQKPTNYYLDASDIGEIEIRKADGSMVTIPFAEIIEALESRNE